MSVSLLHGTTVPVVGSFVGLWLGFRTGFRITSVIGGALIGQQDAPGKPHRGHVPIFRGGIILNLGCQIGIL